MHTHTHRYVVRICTHTPLCGEYGCKRKINACACDCACARNSHFMRLLQRWEWVTESYCMHCIANNTWPCRIRMCQSMRDRNTCHSVVRSVIPCRKLIDLTTMSGSSKSVYEVYISWPSGTPNTGPCVRTQQSRNKIMLHWGAIYCDYAHALLHVQSCFPHIHACKHFF